MMIIYKYLLLFLFLQKHPSIMSQIVHEKKIEIKTPDKAVLGFSLFEKNEVNQIISLYNLVIAEHDYQVNNGHTIYSSKDYTTFLVLKPDSSAFLFRTPADFKKYKSGITYWHTSLLEDSGNIYVSFNLRPDKAYNFLVDGYVELNNYKPFEGYKAYQLPTKEVLFIRVRTKNIYDGYWFPTLRDFDYAYRSFAY